jgi:ABC-type transport system involved in multi-copper enzyme maturation permease subunit
VSDLPPPSRPYRAVALFHAALAAVIVLVAGISGGDVTKAIVIAAVYFVVATGWSWFRFFRREAKSSGRRAGEGGEGI